MRTPRRAIERDSTPEESPLPPTISAFYGYPVEQIAEWCGVSIATAHSWKYGTAHPKRSALRLFTFMRDGRLLGNPHWDGWQVRGDKIIDPEGNVTTAAQLRAYALIVDFARELARDRGEATLDAYRRLLA
jgi:hypothetical protein